MQDSTLDVIFRWILKNVQIFEDIIRDKHKIRKIVRTTKPDFFVGFVSLLWIVFPTIFQHHALSACNGFVNYLVYVNKPERISK